jgi:hypothetical protein
MIDFTSSQLTWIVIGACSIGGTGYLSMDGSIKELDKKAAITQVKAEQMEKKLTEVSTQLDRIEQALITQNSKKGSR